MPSRVIPNTSWIQKRQAVCGGDACIRDTRMPVWSIIRARQLGISDIDLQTHFVTTLTADDVQTALDYYADNAEEIETDIRLNEEA